MKKRKGKVFVKGYESAQKAFLMSFALLFLFSSIIINSVTGQTQPTPKTEPKIVIVPPQPAPTQMPRPRIPPARKRVENESPAPAEKSIKTDAKVTVTIPCIAEGNVRINGWDRNEVRAFVKDGSKVGFSVLQKKMQSPIWIKVLGFDPQTDKEPGLDECLSGSEIELDVPKSAIVSLKSRASQIKIDSVAKVKIENVGGNILLSNIAGGIEANTYEGDVIVEKSSGSISLFATTGNIVAFEVEPSEIGDAFRAKTRSGMVNLQSVGHAQIDVGSASGSIRFVGEFASGGQYAFNTTSGAIQLSIPAESSCRVTATYSMGAFQSDIPLKDVQQSPDPRVQKMVGILGTGDANLNLTTFSGAIKIRKK